MRTLLALVMGVMMVVAVGCGGQEAEPAADVEAAKEALQEAAEEAVAEEVVEEVIEEVVAEEVVEEVVEEAAAEEGVALTAETLVGTKWEYEGITAELQADGKLLLNDFIEGTWSVDGEDVTVSSDMGEYVLTIEGDVITMDGSALTRVD